MPKTLNSNTHEAIVDAAERLLDRYGYGKMTMTDLAEEAGIGVGTTYLHFGGKVDVALAVVHRFHQNHMTQIGEIARSSGTAGNRLKAMLTARILLRFETARLQKHPVDEFVQAIKSVFNQRCIPWKEEENALFLAVVEEGRAAGEFHCDDAGLTVRTLFSATYSLLPHNLGPADYADPDSVKQRTESIAHLLVQGLRTPENKDDWEVLHT